MSTKFQRALREAGVQTIADELGLSHQAVNYWASGERLAPFKRVEWLARRLEISPADIRPDLARIMEGAAE